MRFLILSTGRILTATPTKKKKKTTEGLTDTFLIYHRSQILYPKFIQFIDWADLGSLVSLAQMTDVTPLG